MNSAAQHVPEQGMSPGPTKGENGGAVGSRSFSIEVGEGKHKLNVEKCSPTNPSESTKLPAASLMGQVFKNRTEKIPEGSEPVPAVLRSFSYTKTPQGLLVNILHTRCQCFSDLKAQPQMHSFSSWRRNPTRKVEGCNSELLCALCPFPHGNRSPFINHPQCMTS